MRNDKIRALTPMLKHPWSKSQQRLLEVLQREELRKKSPLEICRLAGYKTRTPWELALKDEQFVAAIEELGISIKHYNRSRKSHLEVKLAANLEEELEKDVWDMRQLKHDYPKHRPPAAYEVDFTWIANPLLREQIKRYFRRRLPRWKAYTFQSAINHLKPFLMLLPPGIHMGTLERSHIEALLPEMERLSAYQANRSLREMKIMVEYMATSPAWTGPCPPRFLIWDEDIPRRPELLPRPIPPDVLDQFDPLLEQAIQAMKHDQTPTLLSAVLWDAVLILRHTGMRAEDLIHLKAPDEHDRNGCLEQDSEGYWWIRIHYQHTKMGKDHRIPTRISDGVIEAIRRQSERIRLLPDHFGEHYLFRTPRRY